MEIFCQRLLELRTERNLTYTQLAKKLNVSATAISRWENGQRIPNIVNLKDLAKAFDVSADYLLGLED